ncbi:MAG: F0F1 ATP synthase subunit B [Chloroflexi bacterium]|nr:F0F1 ATP synthase subunit B [Chloroflexota bacterium]
MGALGFHIPSLIIYLVNFLILLVVLYLFGYKPLLRMMDQRATRIRESLEEAERVRRESEERQAEMQRRLEEARQEGQQFLQQAREMAERYRQEESERARKEAQAMVERARSEIQREREQAVEELRQEFAALAVAAAERVIQRSLNAQDHRDIIEDVLKESEEIGRS